MLKLKRKCNANRHGKSRSPKQAQNLADFPSSSPYLREQTSEFAPQISDRRYQSEYTRWVKLPDRFVMLWQR